MHAGYTLLDVIHAPLWNGITARLPMWLAPNLITLSGLIGILASYLISAFYLPDFVGAFGIPWLQLWCGSTSLAVCAVTAGHLEECRQAASHTNAQEGACSTHAANEESLKMAVTCRIPYIHSAVLATAVLCCAAQHCRPPSHDTCCPVEMTMCMLPWCRGRRR